MEGLSQRNVIGKYRMELENASHPWVSKLGVKFESDQKSETYPFLGASPAMREWIGGRKKIGLKSDEVMIVNKHYESTLEIPEEWQRRDKTAQIMLRIKEQAARAQSHWASLLSDLIVLGESGKCYDGKTYFATNHTEGKSGTQDNDLTSSIVLKTSPTVEEMEKAILAMAGQMYGFKDDQGEPINETAENFLVMIPPSFQGATLGALKNEYVKNGESNTIVSSKMNFEVAVNPRLNWTDKFAVFRTDAAMKPFIIQEERVLRILYKDDIFDHGLHLYGVDAWRGAGFGYWQYAVLMTFTTSS